MMLLIGLVLDDKELGWLKSLKHFPGCGLLWLCDFLLLLLENNSLGILWRSFFVGSNRFLGLLERILSLGCLSFGLRL